jgi:hypothetical protein
MEISKISADTRLYLTRRPAVKMYIRPDKNIPDNNLYLLYDLRVNGVLVIPNGTRFSGTWITENDPEIAAQLQLDTIYLTAEGQDFIGDSDIFNTITAYTSTEIGDADVIFQKMQKKTASNLVRRHVNYDNKNIILTDNNCDAIFIEIPSAEIPITVTQDFAPFLNI